MTRTGRSIKTQSLRAEQTSPTRQIFGQERGVGVACKADQNKLAGGRDWTILDSCRGPMNAYGVPSVFAPATRPQHPWRIAESLSAVPSQPCCWPVQAHSVRCVIEDARRKMVFGLGQQLGRILALQSTERFRAFPTRGTA